MRLKEVSYFMIMFTKTFRISQSVLTESRLVVVGHWKERRISHITEDYLEDLREHLDVRSTASLLRFGITQEN